MLYFVLFESKIRYFLFSILWQNLNGKDGGLGLVEVWFAQNSRQTSQYIALQLTDSIKERKKEKHTLYFYPIHVVVVLQTKNVYRAFLVQYVVHSNVLLGFA